MWKEIRSHVFSVKFVYQVALQLKDQLYAEHFTAGSDWPAQKKIWALNVPPKVHTFVWRTCSNILPTRKNLHLRRVRIEPRYELCCHQVKLVGRILWECPLARNVQALCHGRIQKCFNTAQDFFRLFRMLDSRLSQLEVEKWVVVSWTIWNA